jgi:hypothetical protein
MTEDIEDYDCPRAGGSLRLEYFVGQTDNLYIGVTTAEGEHGEFYTSFERLKKMIETLEKQYLKEVMHNHE